MSESKRHLEARTTLYLLLKDALAGQAAIGSEQFVYWDATDPQKCLSPDVFVKRGCTDALFDTWKGWERGSPDVAVEIVSASDRRDQDWDEKLARYRASGIAEVVRFDPMDRIRPVRIWDHVEGDLVERAPESADPHECAALGLWWVVVPSDFGPQLRLARDREGTVLLPTPDEDRIRLAQELSEERKARALEAHKRMIAEHALQHEAEARRQEAKARRQEAEARRQEAEARRQEAEARAAAERERDAAVAELAALRAQLAAKSAGDA